MLKGIDADDRPFIGRNAIRRSSPTRPRAGRASACSSTGRTTTGSTRDAGLIPPKDETPLDYESMLYDDDGNRIGYATSLMYSPMLQRHIAMARVQPDLGAVGSRVNLELTINHEYQTVARRRGPHCPCSTPQRKTA